MKKITTRQKIPVIEKEIRRLNGKIESDLESTLDNDSFDISNTVRYVIDYMENGVDGWFLYRENEDGELQGAGEGTICNISDAFDWILGETPTELFISNYLELDKLSK